MYLTVPALGIEGARVVSDSSKEAMDQGVIHVPGTGFPWLPSSGAGSNTYLAAHRIGYPGTGSDRVFYGRKG
jgi:sortase A